MKGNAVASVTRRRRAEEEGVQGVSPPNDMEPVAKEILGGYFLALQVVSERAS